MNRWMARSWMGMAFGVVAQGLAAQDSVGAGAAQHASAAESTAAVPMTLQIMPASYAAPPCVSQTGLRRVSKGIALLKAAFETTVPDKRTQALRDGQAAITGAIKDDSQDKNVGAWYSLGQIYLYLDDFVGADSAFRRVSSLAPICRADVDDLRYAIWAPLMNGGIELSKGERKDSALVLFRKAAAIYPDKPHAALNAGVMFANAGTLDSAIVYFGKASAIADRAKMTEERNRATFNMAAMLQQKNRHAEAAEALEKYISWNPDDKEAKAALSISYRAAGQTEKAQALDKELFAAAGLSDSGAVRVGGGADTANNPAFAASLAMRMGINLYKDEKYRDAAEAFKKVLEIEPNSRDAINNLASSYYVLKEGAELTKVSLRLVGIEPLSENALELLASGYRLSKDIDNAVKIAEQLLALPVDVSVKEFLTRSGSAKLTMTAAGRAPQTPAGNAIAPVALKVKFEFLDATGATVATKEAEVPALKVDQGHELVLEVEGKGIVAWRYSRK